MLMDVDRERLIGRGLFQRLEAFPKGRVRGDIDFSPARIRILVASFVYTSRVGRIPYLLVAEFKDFILRRNPSVKRLSDVLESACEVGFSRDEVKVEHYLRWIEQRIVASPCKTRLSLVDSAQLQVRTCQQRAGYFFVSVYVLVDIHYQSGERKRALFSGGRGAPRALILPTPKVPRSVDFLGIERACGDHLCKDSRDHRNRLEQVLERALDDQCIVLIPAFSIGCTQELFYELKYFLHRPALRNEPGGVEGGADIGAYNPPIIIGSPFASRFARKRRELVSFGRAEAPVRSWSEDTSRWPSAACLRWIAIGLGLLWSITWRKAHVRPLLSQVMVCLPVARSSAQGHARGVLHNGVVCLNIRPKVRVQRLRTERRIHGGGRAALCHPCASPYYG